MRQIIQPLPGERKSSFAKLKGRALPVLLAGSLASSAILFSEYHEEHQRAEQASNEAAGLNALVREKSQSQDHNMDLLRECMSELSLQSQAGEELLIAHGGLMREQQKLLEDKIQLIQENSALNRRIGGLLGSQNAAITGRIDCLEQLRKEREQFDADFSYLMGKVQSNPPATPNPAKTSTCTDVCTVDQ